MRVKQTAMPEPKADESDDLYRARLRTWFDTIPSNNTGAFRAAEWENLCAFQGITSESSGVAT